MEHLKQWTRTHLLPHSVTFDSEDPTFPQEEQTLSEEDPYDEDHFDPYEDDLSHNNSIWS